ncbi:MAG: DUF4469 domain-containing protein, partial [Candidatus Symbiothrix sp.]|nr:DUF4469 domain-containing protein [Candidatus Symbiothrix sp.]
MVNLWLREMAYRLCDGFSVNTGWFTAAVHIKGVFRSMDDPEATYPVEADEIVINNPSELMIVIPEDLMADTYKLEITTQYSSDKRHLLNNPRTAVFDKIL